MKIFKLSVGLYHRSHGKIAPPPAPAPAPARRSAVRGGRFASRPPAPLSKTKQYFPVHSRSTPMVFRIGLTPLENVDVFLSHCYEFFVLHETVMDRDDTATTAEMLFTLSPIGMLTMSPCVKIIQQI